jgi:hypothetical protein
MAIPNPTKPWAIVLCHLKGTAPPIVPGLAAQSEIGPLARSLVALGTFDGHSVGDFWHEQTLGQVSFAGSKLFDWAPLQWDLRSHPGSAREVERKELRDVAASRVGDLGNFRGVIAIFNFQCNQNNVDGDVVWSLNAYGAVPGWGDPSWRRCETCFGLLHRQDGGLPCPGGGTHRLTGPRRYMTVIDTTVPKLRTLNRCGTCGLFFAADQTRRPGATECAGGGAHVASGDPVTALSRWPDPPADREWSVCSRCRTVVPDWAGDLCPASTAGHEHPEPATLAFPFDVDLRLADVTPRAWLAHESGHALGFHHGRGIAPRSENPGNDHWPGAYGDPFGGMSFGNGMSYTPTVADAGEVGLGSAGPSISLHHLLSNGVLPSAAVLDLSNAALPRDVVLRPLLNPGPGPPALKIGPYFVEYRERSGWNRAIEDGGGGGALLAYHVPAGDELPVLVPSRSGRPFVSVGDAFEARLGMGNTEIELIAIDRDQDPARNRTTARVRVSSLPQFPGSRHFQRWLVLPCRHAGSSSTFDLGRVRSVLRAAERFWDEMAAGAFSFGGSYVLSSSLSADGNGHIELPWELPKDWELAAPDRVRKSVDAALSMIDPSGGEHPHRFFQDWRWFTGIIVLRDKGGGAGFLGQMPLPSGVRPTGLGSAAGDMGVRLDPLPYDVIELSYDELDQRRLAQEIGRSVGVGLAPRDSYTVMAQGGTKHAYTAPASGSTFGDVAWGAMGPSVDAGALSGRGWLGGAEIDVKPRSGGKLAKYASGSVTLSPLCRAGARRAGTLRALIGPYAFELRVPSGWDSGLSAPVVLASQVGLPARALTTTGTVSWGSGMPELGGGGHVTVDELDGNHAKLSYFVSERSLIVLGGGVLHGGGTILIGTDGVITRIPPGDPYEHRFTELFREIGRLGEVRSRKIDHD